jgi:hypothetical protein
MWIVVNDLNGEVIVHLRSLENNLSSHGVENHRHRVACLRPAVRITYSESGAVAPENKAHKDSNAKES